MTEAQIKIAAKLFGARATMRRLFGDKYQSKIDEMTLFIRAEMEKCKCNELIATMNIVRDLQRDRPGSDVTQGLIFSACVELLDKA